MKKEILEEVNRFREIMSLKPLNMINEVGGVGAAVKMSLKQIYKAFGKEVVENAIKEEVEVYAKNFAKQVKQGTQHWDNFVRNSVSNINDQRLQQVIKSIEKNSGKTVTKSEVEFALKNEMIIASRKWQSEVMEYGTKIGKQQTKKGTWEAIKQHFGKHWKKYAAAGLLAAIFAYFYPGETPPEEEEEDIIPPVPEDGKYRDCPDLPFTKYCKNPKLKEIQECIGAKPDGYYGPETETKLKEKGYSTTITQEVYDKIIENCGKTKDDDKSGSNETQVTQQGTEFLDDNQY